MSLLPRRLSLFWQATDSPLKLRVNDNNRTFQSSKGTQSKLNIKIRKCKLPKDFFSSKSKFKSIIKLYNATQSHQTDRDQQIITDQNNQNQTPKFSQSENKLELFRSSKTLAENKNKNNKILPSNTSLNSRKRISMGRPLRELSTGLEMMRKVSSNNEITKVNRLDEENNRKDKKHKDFNSVWEMPKKLPPLIFNQTFLKLSRRK